MATETSSERRLIIHCDDMGMCQASNLAVQRLFTETPIRTGSVMVPCPWAREIIHWLTTGAQQPSAQDPAQSTQESANPGVMLADASPRVPAWDVGVHLTLTSEWDTYRWRPISGPPYPPQTGVARSSAAEGGQERSETDDPTTRWQGLIDPEGFLWRSAADVARHAAPVAVRAELLAQVETARRWGLVPTHVDTHMGTVFATIPFLQAYLESAAAARVPAMLPLATPAVKAQYAKAGLPVDEIEAIVEKVRGPKLQGLFQVPATDSLAAKKRVVERFLEGLPAGLTQLIIHPAADTPELRAIYPGWQQRVWDMEAFLDLSVYRRLDELGIRLTTWAEESLAKDSPLRAITPLQPS
ncbi:MAG: polysaccharide deacetylase family protein [Limnochordaceae bacterium]|nr:polysaccharide deacetylase family protein [Limnochordaceae bacterium]